MNGSGTARHIRQSLRPAGRLAVVCVLALLVAGCSLGFLNGRKGRDTRAPVSISAADARATPARSTTAGFDGLVIADEPLAAEVARRIFGAGGSAGDAAAALYFALSVTYPAGAGLGGGGVCLVHDASAQKTYSLDFLPRDPLRTGFAAVPGNVKGFEELHRRMGRLPWQDVLEPATDLAKDGFRVTDALAQRLAGARSVLQGDAALADLFLDRDGQPLNEGRKLRQKLMAKTLRRIQSRGSRAFYEGGLAKRLVIDADGRLTREELKHYHPVWVEAAEIRRGGRVFAIPAARTGSGAFLNALFEHAAQAKAASAMDLREVARDLLRAFGVVGSLPHDFGSTSFLVMHGGGDAVACGITMNGPFGSGRYSPGTGLVFARAPSLGPHGLSGAFLAPIMMGGGEAGLLTFVAVGAGGPRAAAAVGYTALAVHPGTGQSLADVILNNGSGPLDLVNVAACMGVSFGNRCELALDPNGFGLATEAQLKE